MGDNRVERIISLVEWFEDYQPNDLEQIERMMLGLRYVNDEVMENELKQDIYRYAFNMQSHKTVQIAERFINALFRNDANRVSKR